MEGGLFDSLLEESVDMLDMIDLNTETLQPGWMWMNEDRGHCEVKDDGSVVIKSQAGSFWATAEFRKETWNDTSLAPRNLRILNQRSQPESLSISVECTNNFYGEQAGLYAFQDSSNWVKLVKEGAEQPGTAMIVFAYQIAGSPFISGEIQLGQTTNVPRKTLLRLQIVGNVFAASVSTDGAAWQPVLRKGGYKRPISAGVPNKVQEGDAECNNLASAPLPSGDWRYAMVAHSFEDEQEVTLTEL
jgi:hypothetical protein